jgi:alpha-mannosidase
MYYVLERIQKVCSELKNYVYTDQVLINDYEMLEGNYLGMKGIKQAEGEWKEFHTEDLWGGRDAINPQFILYINGEHIQGLDMKHREVIISDLPSF